MNAWKFRSDLQGFVSPAHWGGDAVLPLDTFVQRRVLSLRINDLNEPTYQAALGLIEERNCREEGVRTTTPFPYNHGDEDMVTPFKRGFTMSGRELGLYGPPEWTLYGPKRALVADFGDEGSCTFAYEVAERLVQADEHVTAEVCFASASGDPSSGVERGDEEGHEVADLPLSLLVEWLSTPDPDETNE